METLKKSLTVLLAFGCLLFLPPEGTMKRMLCFCLCLLLLSSLAKALYPLLCGMKGG